MTDLKLHLDIEKAYRHYESGHFAMARQLCGQVLRSHKNDLRALHLLAMIAFALSEFDESAKFVSKCLAACPKDPILHYEMGRILASQGRYIDSIARFNKAIALKPGYLQAIVGKADVQERQGDRTAARATLQPLLNLGAEDDGMAAVLMKLMEHDGKNAEAAQLADRLLQRPPTDPHSRTQLWMQAGRVHDRLGNVKEAFDSFAAARKSVERLFNPDEYAAKFDRMIDIFTRSNLRMLPQATNRSEVPVFIACMPRSGSTLVEQIIHAHPNAFGAGEINHITELVRTLPERIESFQHYPACLADLTPAKVDRLADEYLAAIRKLAPKAKRITNKDIQVYQHLGIIQILFPKARIIHVRRHRIDNSFACFMAGLSSQQFPWVSSLQNIGIAWRQYERLMAHWRETLDLPMLEVEYEQLVENTEYEIRRIIEFCGLEWDDRCLRYWEVDRKVLTLSYDQVRKPIFKTAVMRYKRYEQFLEPLIEALGEEIV